MSSVSDTERTLVTEKLNCRSPRILDDGCVHVSVCLDTVYARATVH